MKLSFQLSLFAVLAAPAFAQSSHSAQQQADAHASPRTCFRRCVVAEVVVGDPTEVAPGLHLDGDRALVSVRPSSNFTSELVLVDIDCPMGASACTTWASGYSYGTWSEPFVFDGIVYKGHRFGPPSATPLTGSPCSSGPVMAPAVIDSGVDVDYFWKGIDAFHDDVSGQDCIAWSAALTSSNWGGLVIYTADGTLTRIGDETNADRSACDLKVSNDADWCYQLDTGARHSSSVVPMGLCVWDISDVTNPVLTSTLTIGSSTAFAYSGGDLEEHPGGDHLFGCFGYDGLKAIDISTRSAPVVTGSLLDSGLFRVEGAEVYNDDLLLVTAFHSGLSTRLVAVVSTCDPTSPALMGYLSWGSGTFQDANITDLEVQDGLIYMTTKNANDEPVVRILF